MPWFSYHGGHSGQFCHHAKDTLVDVVERAIACGFTHYGLSEHCPRYRKQDLFGEEVTGQIDPATLLAEFQGYTAEAAALRERYAGRIELLVGFETERLPPSDWAARMTELREQGGFEYIVGSVHDVDGVFVDFSAEQTRELAEQLGGVEALQLRYFDALTDLVETLRPEVVGHIDLVRKFDGPDAGFSATVMRRIERTLEAVEGVGGVLDVNCGAHRRGLSPVYPLPAILERAHHMGIGVTLGDDSHGIHSVGVGLDDCMQVIADVGYAEVCYLARQDGAVQWQRAPLDTIAPHNG